MSFVRRRQLHLHKEGYHFCGSHPSVSSPPPVVSGISKRRQIGHMPQAPPEGVQLRSFIQVKQVEALLEPQKEEGVATARPKPEATETAETQGGHPEKGDRITRIARPDCNARIARLGEENLDLQQKSK